MRLLIKLLLYPLVLALSVPATVMAEEAPVQQLVICSQNLHNLGEPPPEKGKKKESPGKNAALVARFAAAGCDVIAAQELYGENDRHARNILGDLTEQLTRQTHAEYRTFVGDSRDGRFIRNALIIRADLGEVQFVDRFTTIQIPKLELLGPNRFFSRSPIGVGIKVTGRGRNPLGFFFVSAHFKSKVDSWRDPTETGFESLRMEMAEGLRTFSEARAKALGSDAVPVIMLDRNNNEESASARVLTGDIQLADFFPPKPCSLDRYFRASCPKNKVLRLPQFTALLAAKRRELSNIQQFASYFYRSKYELIDDLLIPASRIALAKDNEGQLRVGLAGGFRTGPGKGRKRKNAVFATVEEVPPWLIPVDPQGEGSDHRLVWARLSW